MTPVTTPTIHPLSRGGTIPKMTSPPISKALTSYTCVADAHTTEDLTSWGTPAPAVVIAHTNLCWEHPIAPGREAATVTRESVSFR